MGFSSFWANLRGKNPKEISQSASDRKRDSRYQVPSRDGRPPFTHAQTTWDTRPTQVEPPHTTTKKAKRRSLWRPTDHVDVQEEPMPLITEKSMKRRSFWRSQSIPADVKNEPPMPARPVQVQQSWDRPTTASTEKLSSHISRRLSIVSITKKATSNRKSRASWFGGAADDDSSDDDVPAVPTIPTYLAYERRRDMGNKAGPFTREDFSMGLAITSDDVNGAISPGALSPVRSRQQSAISKEAKRLSMTRRKSTVSTKSNSSSKSKRKSWFASNPASDSDVPPVPALAHDNLPSPNTNSTFESDFERFLMKAHNVSATPKRLSTAQPTDYESFLTQSEAYDTAKAAQRPRIPEPTRNVSLFATNAKRRASYAPGAPPRRPPPAAHSSSYTALSSLASHATPSSSSHAAPTLAPVATARRSWHRPATTPRNRQTMPAAPLASQPVSPKHAITVRSPDQQAEWDQFQAFMQQHDEREEDGVMGMLREFSREEEDGGHGWSRLETKRREIRVGSIDEDGLWKRESVYENEQALKALEAGVAR
ncbi:hypothetical protein B0A48_10811 [Cryoendolithus antarcticus]|uniref:Uncharacterized protein n=1 Tax=Cryoendolithus antarcticus TaxID=1507870 RepID=A0A1V8SYV8_9PEZI|nr:hypothetical protein B0A48_10811 [Cryoendolithus antarcticus]